MAQIENAAQPPLVKLLLLGGAGVGKTSLRLRFAKGVFSPGEANDAATTTGAAFSVAHVYVDGAGVSVQLWDGAAADSNVGLSYHGVVAVFDVTNSATLAAAETAAAQVALEQHPRFIPRILVGTKCDRSDRTVTPAEGGSVAQRHGMQFFEVSSSTGAGVRKAFDFIVLLGKQTRALDMLREAYTRDQRGPEAVLTMIHRTSEFGARAAAAGTCCCLV